MSEAPLWQLSIVDLAARIRTRRVTAAQAVEACLERIACRDAALNAFTQVLADSARAQAHAADEEITAGRYRGPLHGVPVSIKDLIDMAGLPTTAASRVQADHVAQVDASVVARVREAGAVIVGKCSLHEFAYGTTGEDSAFGPTRNPWDLERSPGGSSGGSAAAVADGLCFASVGTDTGGSIRIPAAACGVVGLKPSYGEVPCDGIVPLSMSLDHAGPIARSVNDVWLMYRCLVGQTPVEPLIRADAPALRHVRLGIPEAYFFDLLDEEVRARFHEAAERLRGAGCELAPVRIRGAGLTASVYLHTMLPEATAYHAAMLEARPDAYTRPVRLRLELGRYVLAEDYVRAQQGRHYLRGSVDEALRSCDALMLPTLPIAAPRLGESAVRLGDRVEPVRHLTLRLTQLFNVTGHPAITLPCGRSEAGLPCGLQLVGRTGRTADLVRLAFACEARVSQA